MDEDCPADEIKTDEEKWIMDIVDQVEKEVKKDIEEYKNHSEDHYDFGE